MKKTYLPVDANMQILNLEDKIINNLLLELNSKLIVSSEMRMNGLSWRKWTGCVKKKWCNITEPLKAGTTFALSFSSVLLSAIMWVLLLYLQISAIQGKWNWIE